MTSTVVSTLLLVGAILLIAASSLTGARKSRRDARNQILASWGRHSSDTCKIEELKSIATCFLNRKRQNPSAFFIDDIPWSKILC
jgi:hypothetical protein